MIAPAECYAHSGEIYVGLTPSERRRQVLASYLLDVQHGAIAVREMIVCDLRSFLDLGAKNRAADLQVAPRLSLSDFPGARSISSAKSPGESFCGTYVRCRFRVYAHASLQTKELRGAKAYRSIAGIAVSRPDQRLDNGPHKRGME